MGRVMLPTGFRGGITPFSHGAGNVDELFAVSLSAVFMGSSKSAGITWWQGPSLSVFLLLSPPLAHFCCDSWSSNPGFQLARGV